MWIRKGRIYEPTNKHGWRHSHAYVPTALVLDDYVRVYVSFWDENNIGRIGYIEFDPTGTNPLLFISDEPVLDVGRPGTFDDNGVTPSALLKINNDIYLYYVGWQLGVKVRYFLFLGLAISKDGGKSFKRSSEAPILDRKDGELFVRSGATIIKHSNKYMMWYAGGDRWLNINGKDVPTYSLRYIESRDPTKWDTNSMICLEPQEGEIGFGRPSVIFEDNIFKMWYSVRSVENKYRIGYAESSNGLDFVRKDEYGGLKPSSSGWDSEMTAFGAVFDFKGARYMVYNGNNFGETGIGLAIWED